MRRVHADAASTIVRLEMPSSLSRMGVSLETCTKLFWLFRRSLIAKSRSCFLVSFQQGTSSLQEPLPQIPIEVMCLRYVGSALLHHFRNYHRCLAAADSDRCRYAHNGVFLRCEDRSNHHQWQSEESSKVHRLLPWLETSRRVRLRCWTQMMW